MMSDVGIRKEVLQELQWDTGVGESNIGVEVEKGAVTLVGSVSSFAKKLAAQEAAYRVVGVLDVMNDIDVKIPRSLIRTDAEIARAVRQALEWNVLVPDGRIQSYVTNGWVTLQGTVQLLREREDAERAMRCLMSVRGVINKIVVRAPQVHPDVLRGQLEQALKRSVQAGREHIEIVVVDGAVTLSGWVRCWAEKEAVIGAIRHAPGVRCVNLQLRIDPYV